jgi:hypothetical protein
MSTDDSADQPQRGEILKASTPGSQVQVGMEVKSLDGERIGRVKSIREGEFLLDRPMARDLWVPMSAVLATEDSSPVHGPVEPTAVVLEVTSAHIDRKGWKHA